MTCYYLFTSVLLCLPTVVRFVLCSWNTSGICAFYLRNSVIRMFIGFLQGEFGCTRRCGSTKSLTEIKNVCLVIINLEIAPPHLVFRGFRSCCARTHTQLPPLYTTLITIQIPSSKLRAILVCCVGVSLTSTLLAFYRPSFSFTSCGRSGYPYHYSSWHPGSSNRRCTSILQMSLILNPKHIDMLPIVTA